MAARRLQVSLNRNNVACIEERLWKETAASSAYISHLCPRLLFECRTSSRSEESGSVSASRQVKSVCRSLPRRLKSSSQLKSKSCGVATEAAKRRKVVVGFATVNSPRECRQPPCTASSGGALKYSHLVPYLKYGYLC